RHFKRSTFRRQRIVGSFFWPPGLHVAAACIAGQANRRSARRGGDLYRWASPLANRCLASIGSKAGIRGIAHRENKRSHCRTNPSCPGRLVLGTRSLENAPARFPSRSIQARRLSATRYFGSRLTAIPNSHSL